MTRVKICGVNSAEAFDAAADAGADWLGLVFFPRSPRFVTPAQAAVLSARRQGGPQRVGLFVEPADQEIADTLAVVSLDILQVYAAPARVAEISLHFGLPVWRSVHVGSADDLPGSAGAAAALLIEPRPPPGATRPGGNATALDWTLLGGWAPPFPWLLAGGLTPDNVARAIAESGATAVDVSSGVETTPGQKSPALIEQMITAVRSTR